ncbi:MAG: redox-regulated ATPase YchF [Treponema sp.]|jgi:GTP-binding protein YchF|nr:redox-regulated ATPase YchF [Treponema sp.]
MALNCGIIGLPNVGKSTIFSALSSSSVEIANYPFCTIKPNVGVVNIIDERLDRLVEIFEPERKIPATVEFVDIAGLVKGASEGEGLGNQFLSHIREVGVVVHAIRCFDDPNVIHVANKVDPDADIETINVELALADLDTLAKRREKAERSLKVQGKPEQKTVETVLAALEKIEVLLEKGGRALSAVLSDDEKAAIYDCHFITMKPQVYVCNVDEDGMKAFAIGKSNEYVSTVQRRAAVEGVEVIVICGKFEAELAAIEDTEEKKAFLAEIGLKEPGLTVLTHTAYRLLGLRTFFTAGADECRAWTIRAGDTAPKAAGIIHTDFERGFIKAETYSYRDIVLYGSEAKIKEAGKYRVEGREYVVQDGDVLFFKFNV